MNITLGTIPGCLHSANEELGAICVGSCISHTENSFAGVLQRKVLISKLFTVNGFAASTIATGEVPTLNRT